MSFDCTIERQGDTITVAPEGDIDAANAPLLREVLRQVLETGDTGHVDVTMRDVTFLDSSGLGALIAGLKSARQAGGDLRIARPTTAVVTVFELTNLDKVLRPRDSVDGAFDD